MADIASDIGVVPWFVSRIRTVTEKIITVTEQN